MSWSDGVGTSWMRLYLTKEVSTRRREPFSRVQESGPGEMLHGRRSSRGGAVVGYCGHGTVGSTVTSRKRWSGRVDVEKKIRTYLPCISIGWVFTVYGYFFAQARLRVLFILGPSRSASWRGTCRGREREIIRGEIVKWGGAGRGEGFRRRRKVPLSADMGEEKRGEGNIEAIG